MTMNYALYINSKMTPVVKEILSFYSYDNWNPAAIAAALHHYAYQKTEYISRGDSPNRRPFRKPRECWKKGGNCEEKSVLLASLYRSVKTIKSRLTAVRSPKSDVANHLLVMAGLPLKLAASKFLKHFYQKTPEVKVSPGKVHSEKSSYKRWFVADPEMSSYIGDATYLKKKGYVEEGAGNWSWYDNQEEQLI